MREIKFRGKRVDNGEWVYGDFAYIAVPSLGLALATDSDEAFAEDTVPCIITTKQKQHPYFSNAEPYCVVENEYYTVDPTTVGQYTGLKHMCNGDIIDDGFGIGIVEYVSNYAAFRVNYQNGACKWFYDYLDSELKCIEIIGNIHDNPELLKE